MPPQRVKATRPGGRVLRPGTPWAVAGLVMLLASGGGCAEAFESTLTVDLDADAFANLEQREFEVPEDGFRQRQVFTDPDDGFPVTGIDTDLLTVTRVDPDSGPVLGGNRARVVGSGFNDSAEVFVGGRMVQPADTIFVDENTLSIVVPAGRVGDVDVRVQIDDVQAVAEDAYRYHGLSLEPTTGSVAGNTLVNITVTGRDLEDEIDVRFGDQSCTDLQVITPSQLTCRTPAASVGFVPVELRYPDGEDTIVASDAFEYVDAATSVNGGLAGERINGVVNVRVLERRTATALPGAFVMIGDDPGGMLTGVTDENGRLTLSTNFLRGPVTVHVSLDCFVSTSFVAMDASFVTALLDFSNELRCAEQGEPTGRGSRGVAGSLISGELVFPGALEFGVNAWDKVPEPRADEVRVTYVYTTKGGLFDQEVNPASAGANARIVEGVSPVGERGYEFTIFARPGGLAVYALAGLERTTTGDFTPYIMGVTRDVVTSPGEETTDVEVLMHIPLDRRFRMSLSEVPEGTPTGPLIYRAQAHIDLGGEGVLARRVNGRLFDLVESFTAGTTFDFFSQPAFIGSLADARYVLVGGWYTGDYDSYPYTEVIERGVQQVDDVVSVGGFLGIPKAKSPADGARMPDDRILSWGSDGAEPDLHVVTLEAAEGQPVLWRFFVPGNVREVFLPDLSAVETATKLQPGVMVWTVRAVKIDGFDFNRFDYGDLRGSAWTHDAVNSSIIQYDTAPQPIERPAGLDLDLAP